MKNNLILFIVVAALAALTWIVYSKSGSGTLANKPLADFAIEDTAAVTKIVITDHFGNIAKVERIPGERHWRLNDKYYAREDAVELLLKTFKRIRVRGNVSDKGRDNMMKLLVTSGKRAEIFMGGDKPVKIYYVGVPTPDHTGTIMLLEIPGIGRSEEPYVTHMDGFTGFLSTRFFTDESDWRYTGIYDYPNLDFNSIKIINHLSEQSSFEVKYNGENDIKLYSGFNPQNETFSNSIPAFDTLEVKDFLISFKRLSVESFNTGLSSQGLDSLRQVAPDYSIILTDNKGEKNRTDLYRRKSDQEEIDDFGNPTEWDQARFWAKTSDGEFAVAQTFNFAALVRPLDAYLVK